MVACTGAFGRGRGNPGGGPIFAGWVGYQGPRQLNSPAPPAAMPFWIFAAAAIEMWTSERRIVSLPLPRWRIAVGAGAAMIALLVAVGAAWIVLSDIGDARLLKAVCAGFPSLPPQAGTLAEE